MAENNSMYNTGTIKFKYNAFSLKFKVSYIIITKFG